MQYLSTQASGLITTAIRTVTYGFCCLLLLLCPLALEAQPAVYVITGKSIPELRRETDRLFPTPPPHSRLLRSALPALAGKWTQGTQGPSLSGTFRRPVDIPSVYSYRDLAFFCKLEVQLERRARIPIKFRLGDVLYVDYLEGKRDSY